MTKFFKPGSSEVVSPAVEGGDSGEREIWRERLRRQLTSLTRGHRLEVLRGDLLQQLWISTSPMLPPCNIVLHVIVNPTPTPSYKIIFVAPL